MTKFLSLNICRHLVSNVVGLKSSPRRCLTTNETATALRPFLFAVHPDLFGRHPKEQAVNEQSLKLLNQYIERLLSQRPVQPLTLTFYIRDVAATGLKETQSIKTGFRSIRLVLVSKSIDDAVRQILTSCNLPLDYFHKVGVSKTGGSQRVSSSSSSPVGSNPFAQEVDVNLFYGIFAQGHDRRSRQRLAKDTLNSWLVKNVTKARERSVQSKPMKIDIAQLKTAILSETGLVDIRWECVWALFSFRTALKRLLKICRQTTPRINLAGRTIVFANGLGVCIRGLIVLRYDDVPENWVMVLQSLHQYDSVRSKIPSIEAHLSSLLNNAVIGRHSDSSPPFLLVDDYRLQLLKLIDAVHELRNNDSSAAQINTDLTGVELLIECASGPLMVSPSGKILIPSSCPAFLIIDFINENADKARHTHEQHIKEEAQHEQLVEQCRIILGVESLTHDSNITHYQMESCCMRLHRLADMAALAVDLTVCQLRITQFYSVMADGQMCIPWNFEEII